MKHYPLIDAEASSLDNNLFHLVIDGVEVATFDVRDGVYESQSKHTKCLFTTNEMFTLEFYARMEGEDAFAHYMLFCPTLTVHQQQSSSRMPAASSSSLPSSPPK